MKENKCFEPTYEELKPSKLKSSMKKARGFEPTYEELKPGVYDIFGNYLKKF